MRSESWHPVDHLHSTCLGRLFYRFISPKKKEFLCAKCGQRMVTNDVEDLCFCGVAAGQYGRIFQCIKNPLVRPELPNAIVVVEKKIENKKHEPKPDRYARVPSEFDGYEGNHGDGDD